MRFRKESIIFLLFVFGLVAGTARATTAFIDFSTEPVLPAQLNNFAAAGAMQTYTNAGLYTISGGVVLGNPTFLAAFPGSAGSAPNLYGTTDIADPSLLNTITLIFPSLAGVTGVSGVLFNGQAAAEDYAVKANGANTLTFLAVQDDSSLLAFRNFSFSGIGTITSVTITTPNSVANGWDFFVDDITLTYTPSSVPEPSTLWLAFGGLALAAFRRKRFW
jgi:hypothetical protein